MNYNYLEHEDDYRSWKEILLFLGVGLAIGTFMAIWAGTYLLIESKPTILPSATVTSLSNDK